MKKGKIIEIHNYGKVHKYVIEKQKGIHRLFCGLLDDMGFDEDQVLKADVLFEEVADHYLYIGESDKGFEAQLFIMEDAVNLVIKTSKTQEELAALLKNYFEFPK